jgi:zinc transporter ZupT
MLAGVSSTTTLPLSSSASDELALGIPSFLWGCVFGIVGVLVVYLMTDENKDQTKKAFFGCIAGSLIGTVLYVVVFAAAATTATTTY